MAGGSAGRSKEDTLDSTLIPLKNTGKMKKPLYWS